MKKSNIIEKITIIVLGVTGDLARRKLIPALYELFRSKKINNFLFIGAALEDVSPDSILDKARKYISQGDDSSWNKFCSSFVYYPVDFKSLKDFQKLTKLTVEQEEKRKFPGNRLVYLAAPPNFFCDITKNCAESGLIEHQSDLKDVWHRVVYEKPFGSDLKSAQKINQCIKTYLSENQIWRIDHYLSKELVSNIELLRFTNTMFEPLWSSKYIDHMQIVLDEKNTVGERGAYYDAFGAIKDVLQNHMIQLLALVTMDEPISLKGDDLRDAKAHVTQKMYIEDGILGQYKGYKKESHIDPNSKTETYAALKLRVDTPRWKDVPFFLRTGKGLQDNSVAIHIFFRTVICKLEELSQCLPNILTIRISPDAGFLLQLNVKKPGVEHTVPIDLSFCYDCKFEIESMTAYENLLLDIMRGYQSVGVRNDEIEASWNAIDNIDKMNMPLYEYQKGTKGPEQAQEFIKKFGRNWFYGHKSTRE